MNALEHLGRNRLAWYIDNTSTSKHTNEFSKKSAYRPTPSSTEEPFMMSTQARKLFPLPRPDSLEIGAILFDIHYDRQAEHHCNDAFTLTPPIPRNHRRARSFLRLTNLSSNSKSP